MTEEHSASDRLKVRLIGAVALLLVGIVGWFWLLDADNPIEPVAQETAIPPAPKIEPFSVPQPAAPADIAPVGSERDAPVVADVPEAAGSQSVPAQPTPVQRAPVQPAPKPLVAKPPISKPVPAPVPASKAPINEPIKTEPRPVAKKFEMDSNGLPVAWVVQVGAMATQASADKLKEQLIAKGFKAFAQPTKLPNGTSAIKVYVGPKLSREHADAQKKAIDAALKTNTMVVRFPPA